MFQALVVDGKVDISSVVANLDMEIMRYATALGISIDSTVLTEWMDAYSQGLTAQVEPLLASDYACVTCK